MATTEKALRELIIAHGASVVAAGLGGALVGDISARFEDLLLITPSGANYAGLRPAMIALMPLVGEYGAWKGPMKPTGEWRIHLDIVRARPDIGGIVRFQTPFATALAMARKPIPAAHSMIALFGGADRPVRQICTRRHQGTGGPDARGAGPKPCGSAQQLLRADHWPNAGGGAGPGAGARNARPALRNHPFTRSAGHTFGRGSRSHRRATEVEWRRCPGAHRGAC